MGFLLKKAKERLLDWIIELNELFADDENKRIDLGRGDEGYLCFSNTGDRYLDIFQDRLMRDSALPLPWIKESCITRLTRP